ncbi:MAG: ribonuclease H-like domain-containing protein [Acidimicrobiales bacterium]
MEALLDGPEWVDLFEVFTRQLVTGTGAGLKVVATLAGFAWRDDDPSGEASMAWHAEAVGGSGRSAEAARTRLLAYNEDDVRATAAVRSWIRPLEP